MTCIIGQKPLTDSPLQCKTNRAPKIIPTGHSNRVCEKIDLAYAKLRRALLVSVAFSFAALMLQTYNFGLVSVLLSIVIAALLVIVKPTS